MRGRRSVAASSSSTAVFVDPRDATLAHHDLAADQDEVDGRRAGPVNEGVENRRAGLEVGMADGPPRQEDQVGGAADSELPDALPEGRRGGAVGRRHAEDLSAGRHVVVHTGNAVEPEREPHLLEHVAVVVDARLVETEPHADPRLQESVHRRDAAAEAEVRARIAADHHAALRGPLDVPRREPDPVPQREARPEEPEALEVLRRGAARAPARVLALIGGLVEMHVHSDLVPGRALPEGSQRLIGAPVEVGGRQLDADPIGAVLPASLPEAPEEVELIVQRDRLPRQERGDAGREVRRQAPHELLVRLVREAVLVAEHVGVGDSHADVLVRLDDAVGDFPHPRGRRAPPAVDVLHGGDAGLEHLEGGVERVQVRIDGPRAKPAREPQLERQVRRPELERGEPDVVVGVHEAREHDVIGRSQHLVRRVPLAEGLVRPDVADDAVLLEDRGVFQHLRAVSADRAGDDVAASDH